MKIFRFHQILLRFLAISEEESSTRPSTLLLVRKELHEEVLLRECAEFVWRVILLMKIHSLALVNVQVV